eukprot:1142537-Prymnesium_polylepis.1
MRRSQGVPAAGVSRAGKPTHCVEARLTGSRLAKPERSANVFGLVAHLDRQHAHVHKDEGEIAQSHQHPIFSPADVAP